VLELPPRTVKRLIAMKPIAGLRRAICRHPRRSLAAASIGLLVGAVVYTNPGPAVFEVPATLIDEAAYTALFPYYAEFCAVSEMRRKPDWGIKVSSGGYGGHAVLYLNGVCRVKDTAVTEIAVCDDPSRGVGLSVNSHYKNTKWVATEGRDFFYRGDLAPDEPLTLASMERTQVKAKRMGIFEGVEFLPEVFAEKPATMTTIDYMYDVSVATDYAVAFGRDRYCARVPLTRERMTKVVAYLNDLNRPYATGGQAFEWDILRDNCVHSLHNALAAVDLWKEWKTGRSFLVSAFDFPVPRNEFVNLMRRTNDIRIARPRDLFSDEAARAALTAGDWLATAPGALAEARPMIRRNELYDTNPRLIFYDEPVIGFYQRHFDEIFSMPRYTDLHANLEHFAELYHTILARRAAAPRFRPRPLDPDAALDDPQLGAFYARYYDYIARQSAATDRSLAALGGGDEAPIKTSSTVHAPPHAGSN
jgi:hypothetical protein